MELIGLIILVIVGMVAYRFIKEIIEDIDRRASIRSKEEEAKEKRNEERLREQRLTEEIEAAERKYNRVINCPTCNGTGQAYVKTGETFDSTYTLRVQRKSIAPKNTLPYSSRRDHTIELGGGAEVFQEVKLETCPHCSGKGIAYAWFEKIPDHFEPCKKCKGIGKINTTVKADVGVKEQQLECIQCHGTGKISMSNKEIVHIKTLSSIKLGRDFDSITAIPAYLDVEITDENRAFYSKSEPAQNQ